MCKFSLNGVKWFELNIFIDFLSQYQLISGKTILVFINHCGKYLVAILILFLTSVKYSTIIKFEKLNNFLTWKNRGLVFTGKSE